MDASTKPFYFSKTLWGIVITVCSLLTVGMADAGMIPMSADLRSQVFGLSFMGLALAGYGRMSASESLDLGGGK